MGGYARARAHALGDAVGCTVTDASAFWYDCERDRAAVMSAPSTRVRFPGVLPLSAWRFFIPTTGAQAHKGAHIIYVGWRTDFFTSRGAQGPFPLRHSENQIS